MAHDVSEAFYCPLWQEALGRVEVRETQIHVSETNPYWSSRLYLTLLTMVVGTSRDYVHLNSNIRPAGQPGDKAILECTPPEEELPVAEDRRKTLVTSMPLGYEFA